MAAQAYPEGRICKSCHQFKPLNEYHLGAGRWGRVARCRGCVSIAHKQARELARARDTKRKDVILTWTPGRVEMLNHLFEEGLPTSEIGHRMGLTKNTIIGRLHRNGMSRRETGPKFVPQRNLFESSGLGCLWPYGHPGDPQFHFCGGHPLPGKPYCAAHAAIAYRPKEERQDVA